MLKIVLNNRMTKHMVIALSDAEDLPTHLPAALDIDIVQKVLKQIKQTAFTGNAGEIITLHIDKNDDFITLILVGVRGHAGTSYAFRSLGAQVALYCSNIGPKELSLCVKDRIETDLSSTNQIVHFLYGFVQAAYFLQRDQRRKSKMEMPAIHLMEASKKMLNEIESFLLPALEGVDLSRFLANASPNSMMPNDFLKVCGDELTPLGMKVKALNHKELESEGLNLLHAVGKGSKNKPHLIVIEYNMDKKSDPIVLVGKGIMFDAGGYALKDRRSMYSMNLDMTGAAVIVGALKSVALQNLNVPVVAIIAAAENVVSKDAYLIDAIIQSYSGKYVEIIDTDAEGRLVLADALTYAVKNYNPKALVDFATLTGAALAVTGEYSTPFCSNNEGLSKEIMKAGRDSGECTNEIPMPPGHLLHSHVADIKNIGPTAFPNVPGSSGQFYGTSIGGRFLSFFVPDHIPWAHLDIIGASVEWVGSEMAARSTHNGNGVMLLLEYLRNQKGS